MAAGLLIQPGLSLCEQVGPIDLLAQRIQILLSHPAVSEVCTPACHHVRHVSDECLGFVQSQAKLCIVETAPSAPTRIC